MVPELEPSPRVAGGLGTSRGVGSARALPLARGQGLARKAMGAVWPGVFHLLVPDRVRTSAWEFQQLRQPDVGGHGEDERPVDRWRALRSHAAVLAQPKAFLNTLADTQADRVAGIARAVSSSVARRRPLRFCATWGVTSMSPPNSAAKS